MPDFFPRLNLQEGLMGLIAQLQARRSDPIAEGIMRAASSVGQGLGQALKGRQERELSDNRILSELMSKGQLEAPTGTLVDGHRVMDQASPGAIPLDRLLGERFGPGLYYKPAAKPADNDRVTVTSDMLANYPAIKKMGFQAGETIPTSVLNAQSKPSTDLTPQERKLAAKALKVAPEDLEGVSSDVVRSLLPQVFVDPQSGKVIEAPRGARVLPPGPGDKPMSAEAAKTSSLAQSGMGAIDAIMASVDDPQNQGIFSPKNLAGGVGAELFSTLGGTESQIFNDKILEAQDALARLRTGAAITKDEEARYNRLLRGRFKTVEAYKESLKTVRSFLASVDSDLRTGKRNLGGEGGKGSADAAALDAAIDKVLAKGSN